MLITLAGGCRVSDMHYGAPLVEGTLRIWKQIGRARGARAICLRVMEFAPGLSPGIRNEECDQILFMLDTAWRSASDDSNGVSAARGSGWVDLLIDGHPHEVGPDTGVYIRPGETFWIKNPGPDVVTIISSQCPDPDIVPHFINQPATSADSRPLEPSSIVPLADQKAQPTADRWYRVLVDDAVGSSATQFVGSIPPGRAPDHFHQYEEVLFILKGEGRMWAGETNTPITSGSCIYLPKGQVHCVENTGAGELRLLGVFYPAGSPSVRYEA